MCNFPRNAWLSAVASGDAGRIAAARQRVVAARHNCPDLYAQVQSWKPPVKDRPKVDEPRPPVVRRPDPPPRRDTPNPIGTHFRLVSRIDKDAPLPLLFDAARGYYIGLERGRTVKYGVTTGQRIALAASQPATAAAPALQQLGAYNSANGTFYAIGKTGQLTYCNAATLACAVPKGTAGLVAAVLRPSSNPAYDALVLGTDPKGQSFVMPMRGGAPTGRLAFAAFRHSETSADGRFFCAVTAHAQAPFVLSCADLTKRKSTGQLNIGNFDPEPVADKTRWDEADANRQSGFAVAGNRVAVYSDGQLLVIDPAKPSKPLIFRLADSGIVTKDRKFAIRFLDNGARIALWDLREKFDTEAFTFAVFDLETKLPAERVRRAELKFPVRKSGLADAPVAINAFHLSGDTFLFEAPFASPVIYALRDAKYLPFPTPEGKRSDAYYGGFIVPEEGLLFAKYSAIGDYDAFAITGTIKSIGRPQSINVWRLPGPGGYYFFHSLMSGPNEWQSEIRQYIAPAP